MGPPFVDLASLSENERIEILARHCQAGERVAFFVETNKKADRYMRKLGRRVREIKRSKTENGLVIVQIGPVLQ